MTTRMGTQRNITIGRGATLIIHHAIMDDQGTVLDLTGAELRALIKTEMSDPDSDAVAEFDVAVANNRVTLKLDTELLQVGLTYHYDLRLWLPENAQVYPDASAVPLWGQIYVHDIVTKGKAGS